MALEKSFSVFLWLVHNYFSIENFEELLDIAMQSKNLKVYPTFCLVPASIQLIAILLRLFAGLLRRARHWRKLAILGSWAANWATLAISNFCTNGNVQSQSAAFTMDAYDYSY